MTFCNSVMTTLSRRSVIFGLTTIPALTVSHAKRLQSAPQRVLFICQFGSVKSAVAREILRRRARQRGIAITAFSRGITPEPHLSPDVRAKLRTDGIDPDRDALQKLSEADLRAADLVVIFNPLPVEMTRAKVHDWTTVPSMNDTYPLARADLDRRIDQLLDSMVAKLRRQSRSGSP